MARVERRVLRLFFLLFPACASSPHPIERHSRVLVVSETSCLPLRWPVDGILSSPFGMRDGRPHEGIDIAVAEGTPVHAACRGRVAYAGDKVRGYGRLVILQHESGLVTIYAHNSKLGVREGEPIERNQVIAWAGMTGHATGPHVHFEVRQSERPTDPLISLAKHAHTSFQTAHSTITIREADD